MNRRLLGFAGAALLAVIGAFAILAYVRDADDRAQSDLELVEVYMIDDRVPAGADEAEVRRAITTELVQASTVVDGGVTDLAQLDDKVAAVDLVPGEQLLLGRLIDTASFNNGRSFLTSVPDGLHEVTVSLEPQRALGGQIQPGDTVGVVASMPRETFASIGPDDQEGTFEIPGWGATEVSGNYPTDEEKLWIGTLPDQNLQSSSHLLLHKVLVTRVQLEELPREVVDADGNPVDSGQVAPTGNLLVTFALEAPEVERMIFTAEFGSIWLSYEPDDAEEDGTRVQTRGEFYVDEWPEAEAELDPISTEVPS